MPTLGIDLGTGSVKAAVVDDDGSVLAKASRPYEVQAPQPGWAESDPERWWEQTLDAIGDVTRGFDVDAVGLSGQMHGVVLTDEHGALIRPAILWADSRAGVQAGRMRSALGDDRLAALGSAAVSGFAATSLAWVRQHESEAWHRTAHVQQPKDWLRTRLHGEAGTDPSDASGTLLADVALGAWDPTAVDWLGLEASALPTVRASTDIAGTIDIVGRSVPVAVGGADTACALAGLGVEPGQGFIAVGTGAQVVSVLAEPTPDLTLRTHTFATVGAPGTGWYRLGAVQNAGLALTVALRWLSADVAEANAALAAGPRPDDPIFVPTLSGERTPVMNPDLRGSWHGLSLATDRPAMLRSILEAVAQGVALAMDAVLESGARLPDVIPLVGGGTHDTGFRQLLADATGRALGVVEAPDAAVIGAALLAAGRTRHPLPPRLTQVVEPVPARVAWLAQRRSRVLQVLLDSVREGDDGAQGH